MIRKNFTKNLLAVGIMASAVGVQAAELTFNGFASFAVGIASDVTDPAGNSTAADIVVDQPTGAGYNENASFIPDTNYGFQINANLQDGLTATAQITGKSASDYNAIVEWAYLSYALGSDTTVSFGRKRLPLYYYSDFLDVGYAYHWVRAPLDNYAVVISNYDGVSLNHSTSIGDADLSLNALVGKTSEKPVFFAGHKLEADMLGLSAQLSYENISGGINLTHASTRLDFNTYASELFGFPVDTAFLNGFGGTFTAENLAIFNGDAKADVLYASANLRYDDGSLFILSEYGTLQAIDEGAYNIGNSSWYVSTGYRIGSVTPHITLSAFETDGDSHTIPALGTTIEKFDQTSVTVGVRWDFHPSAAFKLEYQDLSADKASAHSLNGQLVTAAIDLVF